VTSDAPVAAPAIAPQAELREQLAGEVLLITGFPGFRARALVHLLVEREPQASFWLLVPPDQLEAAARALSSTSLPRSQLRLIPGEPCAIDFGLSRQTYAELGEHVDRLFALYQTTDTRAQRELCFRANVGSAREIVEFSKAASNLSHVTVLSNALVFGDYQGTARETDLALGQGFGSPAAQSLAVAEALLQRKLADVPVSIVRTPAVLGGRDPGARGRVTGLHRLLAVIAAAPGEALPFPPGASRPVHAVPADFVAEAAYLVSVWGTRGHAYHFAEHTPPTLGDIVEQAGAHYGKRVEHGPGAFGRLLLNNPGFWLGPQTARALSEWAEAPALDTRSGDRLLERAGIRAPRLLDYLNSVLQDAELLAHGKIEERKASTPFEVVA